MGDKSFEEEEFCLPPDLLTDELILMNKENLFKDRRNSPLPPRTPVLTQPPSDSLSYYSNDFLLPPFSSGPKIPQKPWEMMGPTQPILGPVLGIGRSLAPSPSPFPLPPAPPRPVAIDYQVNMNRQGHLCHFTPVPSFNTLPGTHQAGGHFGNGGYDVTPGLAWGDLQSRSSGGVEMTAVGYGCGIKTERAGTGVFLPRRYYNTTPQPRKKSGGSTAQPPPRLIRAHNRKFANMRLQQQAQNNKFANVTPQLQAPRQIQAENRKFANVTPQLEAPPQVQAPDRKFANVTPQLQAPRQVQERNKKFANVTPQLQAPRQVQERNKKFVQAPRQVQERNKKFANVTPQLQAPSQFASGSHISENELVMARKNAALRQEWRKYEPTMKTTSTTDATTASAAEGMRVNNEIRLPQDWTYDTYELFKRTSLDEN